jgi:hypothetical protein
MQALMALACFVGVFAAIIAIYGAWKFTVNLRAEMTRRALGQELTEHAERLERMALMRNTPKAGLRAVRGGK